jgi:hypothetical protein
MQPKPTKPQPTTPNTFQPVGDIVAKIVARTLSKAKAGSHEQ